MARVRRQNLPRSLFAHFLERIQQREISGSQLALMVEWLDKNPEVPRGKWYKPFPGMIVCGEGELIRTFLVPGQVAAGEEVH